jgi:N-acetylmuramoyl-L-alanine amidase
MIMAVLFCFAQPSAARQQPQSATPSVSPAPSASPLPSPATAENSTQPEFLVIIDPSHGGDDKGVIFAPRVFEKDLTLSVARLLRKELQERGIAARLLRDTDFGIPLERRAELCNQQRPSLYIAIHAGEPGKGIRVYSPLLPPVQQPASSFLPWDAAQEPVLKHSNAVAGVVTRVLQKIDIKALDLKAFLRPLNNIVAPAIAVELATDRSDPHSLESPRLQSAVATAVATGIAQARSQLGARK